MFKKLPSSLRRRARRRAAAVLAQGKKDSVVHGHDAGAARARPHRRAPPRAIAEVTLYNIYETLTKINEDGSVTPLLAESWEASPDLKTYTFKLRKGVKFQNGEPFNSRSGEVLVRARAAREQHQQGQEPVARHRVTSRRPTPTRS